MHEQDDQVGAGSLERVGGGVGLGDDAGDLDVGDTGRAHQGGQVLGDRADEADVDATGGGRHPGAPSEVPGEAATSGSA